MAKFNLGLNVSKGMETNAAEARESWSGELPPTGVYEGVVKIISTGIIGEGAKNAGKPKLTVGVELQGTEGGKYDGFIAWSNLNLIDSSIPYINQFLLALTDGSDEQFTRIKKAFYETGPTVDERKKHVLKIGRWNINSPEGELPIKVAIKKEGYYNEFQKKTVETSRIESFLVNENNSGPSGSSAPELPVEEEPVVDLEAEDDGDEYEPTDDEDLLS